MKTLRDILLDVDHKKIIGDLDVVVNNISMDSRSVKPNDVFVAIKGTQLDGEQFIDKAIDKGATAVVCSTIPTQTHKHITYIEVNNTSEALGVIASAFYGHPSQKLSLIGITGTNGKTTTVTLLYNVFKDLGHRVGLISTVRNYIHHKAYPSTHTTPDQIELNRLLSEMVDEGCNYCFMEVSSHAIDQKRIHGIHFAGGVFTNLTHDHLDYHKSFAAYRDVKKQFFDGLDKNAFAISNADDPNGFVMLQNCNAKKHMFSLKKLCDYKAIVLSSGLDGLHMRIGSNDIHFLLSGRFNAYNLLAVFGVAMCLDMEEQEVLQAMSMAKHVDGRFEIIQNNKGVYAIVDYAHTPDAIENVTKTIDELRTRNEDFYVVIGAGGNRDKAKRPIMAAIAARYADKLILTSDNPRNEKPEDIINDMMSGLDAYQKSTTLSIVDRFEAIKTACVISRKGDIVLVAGKGHETYQEIGGVKHSFDDVAIIKQLLNS
jgi:UDP-N-acetylmuramoyl-L-alanyl-D-glutamate--2,6-diaminopimelate ligase